MTPRQPVVDYPHPALNRPIEAIGGHYMLTREYRAVVGDVDILVFEGYGVVETSCCGAGGCRYALVPGDVVDYRHTRLPDGRWVSRVAPIGDRRRRVVAAWLKQHHGVHQVVF